MRSDPNIDANTTNDIIKRAIECCPDLSLLHKGVDDLDVVENVVGIRPVRKGGPRVQNERYSKFYMRTKKICNTKTIVQGLNQVKRC